MVPGWLIGRVAFESVGEWTKAASRVVEASATIQQACDGMAPP